MGASYLSGQLIMSITALNCMANSDLVIHPLIDCTQFGAFPDSAMSLKRITELLDTTVTSDTQLQKFDPQQQSCSPYTFGTISRQMYEESQFGKSDAI